MVPGVMVRGSFPPGGKLCLEPPHLGLTTDITTPGVTRVMIAPWLVSRALQEAWQARMCFILAQPRTAKASNRPLPQPSN